MIMYIYMNIYLSLLAPLFDMIMVSLYYDISTTVLLVVLVELVVVVVVVVSFSFVRLPREKVTYTTYMTQYNTSLVVI